MVTRKAGLARSRKCTLFIGIIFIFFLWRRVEYDNVCLNFKNESRFVTKIGHADHYDGWNNSWVCKLGAKVWKLYGQLCSSCVPNPGTLLNIGHMKLNIKLLTLTEKIHFRHSTRKGRRHEQLFQILCSLFLFCLFFFSSFEQITLFTSVW
jgi:hypothetical protein